MRVDGLHSYKAPLVAKLTTFAYLPRLRNKIEKENTRNQILKRYELSQIAAKISTSFELVKIVLNFKNTTPSPFDHFQHQIPEIHVEAYFSNFDKFHLILI